jgi:hypothetical protein
MSGTRATILMLLISEMAFAWKLVLSTGWPKAGSWPEVPKPIRARKRSSLRMQTALRPRTVAGARVLVEVVRRGDLEGRTVEEATEAEGGEEERHGVWCAVCRFWFADARDMEDMWW